MCGLSPRVARPRPVPNEIACLQNPCPHRPIPFRQLQRRAPVSHPTHLCHLVGATPRPYTFFFVQQPSSRPYWLSTATYFVPQSGNIRTMRQMQSRSNERSTFESFWETTRGGRFTIPARDSCMSLL